jgi:hypothetical protein
MSCEGGLTSVGGDATVRVLLTDAPSEYVGEAWVDFGEVVVIPKAGPPITLSDDGTDGEVNLLDLQNTATMTLAEGIVEPGTYKQLRLIVEDARVVLAYNGEDQYEFTGGGSERELVIPSGAQTGIKLNLSAADKEGGNGGVAMAPGETVLVLDFDVNQSFRIQGNPETPAGITGVHFQPNIRVSVQDVAGSISGAVSTALSEVSVQGLLVTAEPVVEGGESETYQTQTATATTAADGTYTLPFLVPGTYTVSVTPPADHAPDPATATVEVSPLGAVTGIDFTIVVALGP